MNQKKTILPLEQALNKWRNVKNAKLDPQILELFQSGFFKQYQLFTEQIVVVLDHRTMKYLYISENFATLTGYSMERLYQDGINYVMGYFHPDDFTHFENITNALLATLRQLPANEILQCRLSYDYRIRYANGVYHRWLQHNIPLTLDENNNIVHGIVVISEIDMYKRDNTCYYNVVHYKEDGSRTVLLEANENHTILPSITQREKEILVFTADGLTESTIAQKMGISIQTVKTHRKNLFRKTGVKNSMELVRFAMANLII